MSKRERRKDVGLAGAGKDLEGWKPRPAHVSRKGPLDLFLGSHQTVIGCPLTTQADYRPALGQRWLDAHGRGAMLPGRLAGRHSGTGT